MIITAYFDGACKGNNNADKPSEASIGYVIELDNNNKITKAARIGDKTNNEAEYLALLTLLQDLEVYIRNQKLSVDSITIKGDSALVVNQVNGKWKVKKEHLKGLHAECVAWIEKHKTQGRTVNLIWVRREQNPADKIANEVF